MLEYADREIAFFACNRSDFREGQKFDIDVPADLDQFG
jgi:hypothetical protein